MVKITVDNISSKIGKRVDPHLTTELNLDGMEIDSFGSFASMTALEKVDLRNNWIRFPRQVEKLLEAPRLRELDLTGNDVCKSHNYRAFIIYHCQTLQFLDDIGITDDERMEAEECFLDQEKKPFAEMELQKGSQRPVWIPDDNTRECSECHVEFTTLTRRHHCRGCGKIFCEKCCHHWLLLPEGFNYTDPTRTCYPCYRAHSSIDFKMKWEAKGPDDAPIILCIHPAMASRQFFSLQMDAWSANYRVISMDLPAHASRIDDSLNMAAAVEAVQEVVDATVPTDLGENFKKVILVGWALGGYVAMKYAALNPHRVAGLVLGGCSTENSAYNFQVEFKLNSFKFISC
eukprot:TRINITY_DN2363_c0_g1_i3.p1 TRINITY_DN2363_c0_g1~~TRINITY_DN2363_c0_g1_i3.p1  ORF type:complete len:346 (+),score=85.00 TRINITY_DN2363_c0_g1_i3:45-1082(+)